MSTHTKVFVVGSFVAANSAKVERLPNAGESLLASAFVLEPGGKGFNLIVACERLGAEVAGVLPVGDDFISQLAASALERTGLPEAMLCRSPGPTGAGIGFTDAAGDNCLAIFPGANGRLARRDILERAVMIEAAAVTLAQFEAPDEPIIAAFEIARRAGKMTLLNPSPYRTIPPELLDLTSILILNETEAESLVADISGKAIDLDPSNLERALNPLASILAGLGIPTVIVTLGAAGALLFCGKDQPIQFPAFKIQSIDALGAGDAFAAGIATTIAEGKSWREALRIASACGAMVAARWGVLDALPRREEVEAFLKPT